MQHVVLMGDSIFDNGPYVDEGDSVSEVLSDQLKGRAKVTLLAVDGDCSTDVQKQLQFLPEDVSLVIISCGGNDALQFFYRMCCEPISSMEQALSGFVAVREKFRSDYKKLLQSTLEKVERVAVCTVYNELPKTSDLPETSDRAIALLALFNEIILQEAAALHLPIIDLRSVCVDRIDYSTVSPIEPSGIGARKISSVIGNMLEGHDFNAGNCTVYL